MPSHAQPQFSHLPDGQAVRWQSENRHVRGQQRVVAPLLHSASSKAPSSPLAEQQGDVEARSRGAGSLGSLSGGRGSRGDWLKDRQYFLEANRPTKGRFKALSCDTIHRNTAFCKSYADPILG